MYINSFIPDVAAYLAALIAVVGALVILTNITTEVLKKILPDKLPTDILAIFLAVLITMVAFFAYCSYAKIQILWYYVAAALVVGIMVAYAAMFGFDKLKAMVLKMQDTLK